VYFGTSGRYVFQQVALRPAVLSRLKWDPNDGKSGKAGGALTSTSVSTPIDTLVLHQNLIPEQEASDSFRPH